MEFITESLVILRYITMCTILRTNLFVFSNLFPMLSWLSDREEGAFLHIKKPTFPDNEVGYLVAA